MLLHIQFLLPHSTEKFWKIQGVKINGNKKKKINTATQGKQNETQVNQATYSWTQFF